MLRLRNVEDKLCILRAYRRHHEYLAEDHPGENRSAGATGSTAGRCRCGATAFGGTAGLEGWPRGCFVTLPGVSERNDDRCCLSNRRLRRGCERGGVQGGGICLPC